MNSTGRLQLNQIVIRLNIKVSTITFVLVRYAWERFLSRAERFKSDERISESHSIGIELKTYITG